MDSSVQSDAGRSLRALIRRRTGLSAREADESHFAKVITSRICQLRLRAVDDYYEVLLRDLGEWNELIPLLTTGETYFLRDQGQFAVLENFILPALIERNRPRRSLRIWSAGCSTGEEAYSLAILLEKLLPDREGWEVLILGTDINVKSLEQARRGVYGQWSFRMLAPEVRNRYFRARGPAWEIDERIRKAVTFRYVNLVADRFPDPVTLLHEMDLILCRNVFIYFDAAAVAEVVRKFSATLAEHGYLLTGHGELQGHALAALRLRLFPEAVVYQHTGGLPGHPGAGLAPVVGVIPPHPSPIEPFPVVSLLSPVTRAPQARTSQRTAAPQPAPTPRHEARAERARTTEARLREAESLFEEARYRAALDRLSAALADERDDVPLLLLAARAHANLGEYAQAIARVRQATQVDPLNADAYYLLAHLAEESRDSAEVKRCLNQVLYLSPSFVAAYLELALLHEAQGDRARAIGMRRIALGYLEGIPADAPVAHCRGLTAGQLRTTVEELLADQDGAEGASSAGWTDG